MTVGFLKSSTCQIEIEDWSGRVPMAITSLFCEYIPHSCDADFDAMVPGKLQDVYY